MNYEQRKLIKLLIKNVIFQLQTDGEENITKLEKADILELTCRHFRNLQRQNKFYIKTEQSYADRFRDGFSQCAKEVTKFLYSQHNRAGEHIVVHLNECMRRLDSLTTSTLNNNLQIANNNNYIPNDNIQPDLNQPPPQPFPASPFVISANQQPNIRRQSPIIPSIIRSTPSSQNNVSKAYASDNDSSPAMPYDFLSVSLSRSLSPGQGSKDEESVWRPW